MDEDLRELLNETEKIHDSLSPFCLRAQGDERRVHDSPSSLLQKSSLPQLSLAGGQTVVKSLESGMIFHDTKVIMLTKCDDNKPIIRFLSVRSIFTFRYTSERY
jgi:hypothetical protein